MCDQNGSDAGSGFWHWLSSGARALFRPQSRELTPAENDGASIKSRFRLETLEPRILLSGDPVVGEIGYGVGRGAEFSAPATTTTAAGVSNPATSLFRLE